MSVGVPGIGAESQVEADGISSREIFRANFVNHKP